MGLAHNVREKISHFSTHAQTEVSHHVGGKGMLQNTVYILSRLCGKFNTKVSLPHSQIVARRPTSVKFEQIPSTEPNIPTIRYPFRIFRAR